MWVAFRLSLLMTLGKKNQYNLKGACSGAVVTITQSPHPFRVHVSLTDRTPLSLWNGIVH